jgi:endonuclease/exonuclease/phosphatase (EEP) superfamily protein YafD
MVGKLTRNLFLMVCLTFGIALLSATILGFIPQRGYLIDQLSQLRLLYLVALVPLLIAVFMLRSRVMGVLAVLCLMANGAACMPLIMPASSPKTDAHLVVMAANIWGAHNQQYAKLVDLVHAKGPDVICLEEVTPKWMSELKKRLNDYPYSFDEGISGGAAIFSRLPISQTWSAEGKKAKRYGVRGELEVGGTKLLLIATHPASPYSRQNWRRRNQEFIRLAHDVQSSSLPVIVAGDFNSTPWSWYFQNLLSKATLQDSELGKGLQPTWSTRMPLVLVPIDHCLYTSQFATIKRAVGPNVGSDHLPLIVELGIQKPVYATAFKAAAFRPAVSQIHASNPDVPARPLR